MAEFSRMSDPREDLSQEHWDRLDLIRRIDEYMPRLIEVENSAEQAIRQNDVDRESLLRYRADLTNQLSVLSSRRAQLSGEEQADVDRDSLQAIRARKKLVWLLSSGMHNRAELSLERVSSWLREYLSGVRDSRRVSSSMTSQGIAGFYQDIVNLESDQSELRIDMLVSVLRVIAESRPDLLRLVVSDVVDLIDSPEHGGERVNAAILEILRRLDVQISDEASLASPSIEESK